MMMRTDSVSSRNVEKHVSNISMLCTFVASLLVIVSATTPLGLYATVTERRSEVFFTYAKDESPIGKATPLHHDYGINRVCGSWFYKGCLSDQNEYLFTENDSTLSVQQLQNATKSISTSVALNITQVFGDSSTEGNSTIASALDIYYRSFINYNNKTQPGEQEHTRWFDEGRPRTQGRLNYFQSFISNDELKAIDGLVVSTQDDPGIAFRNHTLPPSSTTGYTWTEDLLWLEPQTACTDLNITYEYTIPSPDVTNEVPMAKLVDRGGIVNLPAEYPVLDLNDTQSDPQLLARSWYVFETLLRTQVIALTLVNSRQAAVLTNYILSLALNETNSNATLGTEYHIKDHDSSVTMFADAPNRIHTGPFGSSSRSRREYLPRLPGPLAALDVHADISPTDTIRSDDRFEIGISRSR